VLVTQALTQQIVDSIKNKAGELKKRGSLALIAVGPNVDKSGQLLPQLTNDFVIWRNPDRSPVLQNWENFFWHQAYKCSGSPPTDAPTIGSVATVTIPIVTRNL
jgi:hypothetical protein